MSAFDYPEPRDEIAVERPRYRRGWRRDTKASAFQGALYIPFTQRLILQPRIETDVAFQPDEAVGIGAGLNDVDLGFRLRYEIRREFAPYIGVSWIQDRDTWAASPDDSHSTGLSTGVATDRFE
jgi:uncharacterized protein involved in copper resistance